MRVQVFLPRHHEPGRCPRAGSARKVVSDFANAICQNLGGWGYFARIGGAEAFVEYHMAIDEESLRIVPMTDAGWQPACTVSAKFRTSATTGQRERLESVTVKPGLAR